MRFHVLVMSLCLAAAACQKPPPRRLEASELVGTYKAQTKVIGQQRVGTIRLNADGTYVHEYVVEGVRREQTGTWKVVDSANGTMVRFTNFVADWWDPDPVTLQTYVEAHGEWIGLAAISDEGFWFVKQSEGMESPK
jgi:hypothetical protein